MSGHAPTPNPRMDLRAIKQELRRQGWLIERTRGNHLRFVPPDPEAPIVVTSSTPSDHRSVKNFLARLRRSGFIWEPRRAAAPRSNPGPDNREIEHGRKTWRMWHDKENPKREFSKSEKMLSESHFVPIGKAHEILYSSDKWERDGDNHDYVHEFESNPKVYIPASKARDDETIGAPKSTASVLGLRSPRKSLVVPELAKVRSFSYVDSEGELVEIKGLSGAVMGSSPDKKTLLILARSGPILVRGGQMSITKRGIVK